MEKAVALGNHRRNTAQCASNTCRDFKGLEGAGAVLWRTLSLVRLLASRQSIQAVSPGEYDFPKTAEAVAGGARTRESGPVTVRPPLAPTVRFWGYRQP